VVATEIYTLIDCIILRNDLGYAMEKGGCNNPNDLTAHYGYYVGYSILYLSRIIVAYFYNMLQLPVIATLAIHGRLLNMLCMAFVMIFLVLKFEN
jgi:hypothetical protein